MPQMKPLLWMNLFITIIIMIILLMSFFFFSNFKMNFLNNQFKLNKKFMNLKW